MKAGAIPINGKRHNAIAVERAELKISALCIAVILLGLASICTVLFLFLALAPSFVAYIVDTDKKLFASKIVGLFNLCGICLYLDKLFLANNGLNHSAIELMRSPNTWLCIYTACLIGWIIYLVIPRAWAMLHSMHNKILIAKLDKQRNELCREWNIGS